MPRKAFLYMYPQKEVLDFEIRNHSWNHDSIELQMEFESRLKDMSDEWEKERLREEYCDKELIPYRQVYSDKLNQAIDLRYRKKGFRIFYALLNDTQMSDVIRLEKEDEIIYVGMDEKTHRTPNKDGNYPYPDRDFILDGLGNLDKLIVSGFHLNDCVKKISRRAHLRGINVLVDEELTELFGGEIKRPEFDASKYPSIDPRDIITNPYLLEYFFKRRENKPWLYPWKVQ